ncbi:synaptophysin-like protein 1 isoform X4 [Neomonachus schauinslandi]|uniref:Synaptophysin-like protein 1 isoform X4 n=1 Tax=Neomonachus schauinslandi TaxID=29088 RepID=A0A8M1MY21_NEOSC|nr:synaptophysin-like protein 1 isoform X4 [Neomonachus schauinslandi]
MASNIYWVRQRISRLGQRMSSFQLNINPLKEPLGFIKVLEWIASIFAFATCGGFNGKTEIQVSCPKVTENKTITAAFGYPFRLNEASFQTHPYVNVCDVNWKSYVLIGDYSSSAQFYVTFAVFVFLYCIAALLLYVGYTSLYRDSQKLPMIIFGFLNMILWGGNAWFVYKETSLHSPSNTSASHSQGGIPPPSGI